MHFVGNAVCSYGSQLLCRNLDRQQMVQLTYNKKWDNSNYTDERHSDDTAESKTGHNGQSSRYGSSKTKIHPLADTIMPVISDFIL